MLWDRFAAEATDALLKSDGIVRNDYVEILKQHLKTLARKLKLDLRWVFWTDNDLKLTSKLVRKWLKENKQGIGVAISMSHGPSIAGITNVFSMGTEVLSGTA